MRGKAVTAMIETADLVRAYGDFHHIPKTKSWVKPRRVIAKVEHRPGQVQRCRLLVTSLNRQQADARTLYEDRYCPRGDMENKIKECQLDLFGVRIEVNAVRL